MILKSSYYVILVEVVCNLVTPEERRAEKRD